MHVISKSLLKLGANLRLPHCGGRLPILMFHRVLREVDPLQPDIPTAAYFDAQAKVISEVFCVLPLTEAVERLRAGNLPARAVCITFDDGYRDNYEVARPILNKYRLPATFFVASSFLNGGCMFNDVIVESVRRLKTGEIDLREIALGRRQVGDVASRMRLVTDVTSAAKYLEGEDRTEFCNRLAMLIDDALPCDLMMSHAQVAALDSGGMEVGGHTQTHPILTRISHAEAEQEIIQNRRDLAQITGRVPQTFAYPNGKPNIDFGSEHANMVQAAGYKLAVSTAPAVALPKSSLFSLPRFSVRGATPAVVAARLLRMTYLEEQARA